jgi:hypothetical protein
MADDDSIDAQIKRLGTYLFNERQKRGVGKMLDSTDHEIAIERALASAYVARELDCIRKFLNGLTVLKEKA